MEWLCEIEVDTNDGDIVADTCVISDARKKAIEVLIDLIKNTKPNADAKHYDDSPEKMYSESLNENQIELISDTFHVSSEYGFHTIECIKFYPLAGKAEQTNLDFRWNTQY